MRDCVRNIKKAEGFGGLRLDVVAGRLCYAVAMFVFIA